MAIKAFEKVCSEFLKLPGWKDAEYQVIVLSMAIENLGRSLGFSDEELRELLCLVVIEIETEGFQDA